MIRIALVVIYLISMAVGVYALDAFNGGELPTIWLAASILLGAGTGDLRLAALSLLAIPLAIPFGLPADTTGDPVLPVWPFAMQLAFFSSGLIVVSALGRRFAESRLQRRRERREGIIAQNSTRS